MRQSGTVVVFLHKAAVLSSEHSLRQIQADIFEFRILMIIICVCMQMARDKKTSVVAREYTINLHKRLHGVTFKKRAPRAVKEIKKFAGKVMQTSDVRVDVKLNKAIWSQGIRNVPNKLRIVIQRRRDEEAEDEAMYSLVTLADEQVFANRGVVCIES